MEVLFYGIKCDFFLWAGYLVFLQGKQNSRKYFQTLKMDFLPFVAYVFGESSSCLFQQDDTAIHKSRETSLWMRSNGITTLTWPAKSPNINIIGNVWGAMTLRVYSGHQVYDTIDDLKAVIKDVWESLSVEYMQELYCSIPCRLLAVIDAKGGDTKY